MNSNQEKAKGYVNSKMLIFHFEQEISDKFKDVFKYALLALNPYAKT